MINNRESSIHNINKPKPSPTLFRNDSDLKKALTIVSDNLKYAQDGDAKANPVLVVDDEGFCKIDAILQVLRADMDYVNTTHITELFFKDPQHKILINKDDRIKYKVVKYVMPPSTLYFGTLENLRGRIIDSGIRSNTKGYIKLYDTEERAISFASKFATNSSDKITTIAIDAEKAFSDGLKFSTYLDGEFIAVQVDKKYLKF